MPTKLFVSGNLVCNKLMMLLYKYVPFDVYFTSLIDTVCHPKVYSYIVVAKLVTIVVISKLSKCTTISLPKHIKYTHN